MLLTAAGESDSSVIGVALLTCGMQQDGVALAHCAPQSEASSVVLCEHMRVAVMCELLCRLENLSRGDV